MNNTKAREYNFDGLAGPAHNYAGLSRGNIASMESKSQISRPRQAALEGLEKMKFLMDRGFKQAVLPPHERPDIRFLKELGFTGDNEKIIRSAKKFSPALLAACYSASSMWAANSAVISPRADTGDHKTHLTPANLQFYLHRSLEAKQTGAVLKRIFSDPDYFTHHPPLPSVPALSDEGAANHNRLCCSYGSEGVEVFVYGRDGFSSERKTKIFYPRQTQEASKITAFRHKLNPQKTVLAEQNPLAVDQGAFHNDVVCAVDQNLIFYHELAFADTERVIKEIEEKLRPAPLIKIPVRAQDISLSEAVASYLFNSQLLPIGENEWMLLAPKECESAPSVKNYIKSLTQNSVIREACFIPIRQSMQNGGGPACLRLRAVLTEEEAQAVHKGVLLDQKLYERIKAWIKKHYREQLAPDDLLDPLLIEESRRALDELSQLLELKNIYPFQN